jgi:hypothetical protein
MPPPLNGLMLLGRKQRGRKQRLDFGLLGGTGDGDRRVDVQRDAIERLPLTHRQSAGADRRDGDGGGRAGEVGVTAGGGDNRIVPEVAAVRQRRAALGVREDDAPGDGVFEIRDATASHAGEVREGRELGGWQNG